MKAHVLIAVVVLQLSGLPAAAVACDLYFCTRELPAAAAAAGCHEHTPAAADLNLVGGKDHCSHLVAVDPVVLKPVRLLPPPAADAPPTLTTVLASGTFAQPPQVACGPPQRPPSAGTLPLRI